jgi:predicted protein tyrosine phosphatase
MWDVEKDIMCPDTSKIYKKPSDYELNKIVNFVNQNEDKISFVIHCSAGISRSGAVARFIHEKFNTSYDNLRFYTDNSFIQPNLYILKRLKKLDNKK